MRLQMEIHTTNSPCFITVFHLYVNNITLNLPDPRGIGWQQHFAAARFLETCGGWWVSPEVSHHNAGLRRISGHGIQHRSNKPVTIINRPINLRWWVVAYNIYSVFLILNTRVCQRWAVSYAAAEVLRFSPYYLQHRIKIRWNVKG